MYFEKLKQYNGDPIDLQSSLNDDDRELFINEYFRGPSYNPAVVQFLNERHEKIGNFIGLNNDTIIELGGHLGFFAIMFNKTYQKNYVLEPLPNNFKWLQKLTANYRNIYPKQLAIGIETKILPLFIDAVNETQTSLIPHPDSRSVINVFSIKLEDFCIINNIKQIDFLKIDIEGFELPLVLHESFCNISNIIRKIHCEVHNIEDKINNIYIKWDDVRYQIDEKLKKLGFETEIHHDEIFATK